MIRYTLRCAGLHEFDSWFHSAGAFDNLLLGGRLACPICGSVEVEKALMSPAVRPARQTAGAPPNAPPAAPPAALRPSLAEAGSDVEAAVVALRRQIEESSEYVGMNFVSEARAIHDGDAPERSIYGEARPDEARALLEDGVPVAALPFLPGRKVN